MPGTGGRGHMRSQPRPAASSTNGISGDSARIAALAALKTQVLSQGPNGEKPIAASTIARKKRELKSSLKALLAAATGCDLARQLQAKIARARHQLLTFCDYPGEVDTTNNGSERKLRPCVIQRKVTNGYRALWAAQAEVDGRTTIDTARLNGANPFKTILATRA